MELLVVVWVLFLLLLLGRVLVVELCAYPQLRKAQSSLSLTFLGSFWQLMQWEIIKASIFRPELSCDYLLNLSISVSRGKETNKDSRSNGE